MKPNHKGSATIFENPVLERFTRTHIAVPVTLFVLISVGLLYYGFTYGFIDVASAIALFLLGWLMFTLLEYTAHRYVFHMETDTARKAELQYKLHGAHHHYPKDKERLAMPPIISLFIASCLFFIFKLVFGPLVFGLLAGLVYGYAMYLLVHYVVHAYAPPKNVFKYLWVHHSIHHYKDHDRAFGVSSPLWDWLLGTMPKRTK